MNIAQELSSLRYFFSAYLYQCALEDSSLDEVVYEFVATESTELVKRLIRDLDKAILLDLTVDQIKELGSNYGPRFNQTVDVWLGSIRQIVAKYEQ